MSQRIGLIVGTNRPTAMSYEMAMYYGHKLKDAGCETELMNLLELPDDFAFSALYHNKGKNPSYNVFQEKLDAVQKCIIFIPEYNGSYPGVLKAFIDGLRYPDSFRDKKVALVGLSSGMQGNAIGISHLNDVLSYMGANVLGLRIKMGEISKYFDGKTLSHPVYERFINEQLEKLLSF